MTTSSESGAGKSGYAPIACSVYDVFEAAALRKRVLQLMIDGVAQDYVIHDIFSKGKEEFLKATLASTDEAFTIRLDSIQLIVDHADKKSYFPYEC